MRINYIEKDGVKLFSFWKYDFRSFEPGVFIDGGFEYTRTSVAEFQSGEIVDLIEDIRECQVYQHEEYPLKKWNARLVKFYFGHLLTRVSILSPDQLGLFHILGAEILYRQKHGKYGKAKKARKTKDVCDNSSTVS